ncbi:MAG: acetoacetate decarboxylase family protein [Dehalococcoidia bacterium]|jgi:acetoacetate decarboxylase
MGFVQSWEDLAKLVEARQTSEFYDAEMLTVMWETKPEIVKRLLPAPLAPAPKPIATAFVAYYPKTSFGPPYYEGALFLRAVYDGVEGNYCLAMPVTGDLAMAGGREVFGYPKKMANIQLKRNGSTMEGSLERHGLCFFKLCVKLTGTPNTSEFVDIVLNSSSEEGTVSYNVKHFFASDGSGFDYNPRLIREKVILRPKLAELGEAEVELGHSDYDPWSEVEIVRILGAAYAVGDNTMLKGDVVAELDPIAFAPYAFLKWDAPYFLTRST